MVAKRMKSIDPERILPDALLLRLDLHAESLPAAIRSCLDAITAIGLPQPQQWSIPQRSDALTQGLQDELQRLAALPPDQPPYDGWFGWPRGDELSVGAAEDEQRGYLVRFSFAVDSADPGGLPARVGDCARFCRVLLAASRVSNAMAGWVGAGAKCLPRVPLASNRSHLLLVTQSQVEAAYESPQDFWDSGWEQVEDFDEQKLLLRALQVRSSEEYILSVRAQQWALARAARPGLTRYALPELLPGEESAYRDGAATLEPVAYLPEVKLAEYSCYLESGEHVRGWEVYSLLGLLEAGQLPGGRPLEQVRVVFYDRQMAENEKRPLLDIGVQVLYLAENGETVALES
ncbi:MAG: hypothetical protein AB1894_02880 [Chloroflexota bacterium]